MDFLPTPSMSRTLYLLYVDKVKDPLIFVALMADLQRKREEIMDVEKITELLFYLILINTAQHWLFPHVVDECISKETCTDLTILCFIAL